MLYYTYYTIWEYAMGRAICHMPIWSYANMNGLWPYAHYAIPYHTIPYHTYHMGHMPSAHMTIWSGPYDYMIIGALMSPDLMTFDDFWCLWLCQKPDVMLLYLWIMTICPLWHTLPYHTIHTIWDTCRVRVQFRLLICPYTICHMPIWPYAHYAIPYHTIIVICPYEYIV